jgi:competence protein ComEA
MSAFSKLTLGIPLSLNRENEEGLTAIPGIGPAIARAIVAERTARKGFKSLDELLSVPGIGPKVYTRIAPYLIL